jgi:hypothetical protein
MYSVTQAANLGQIIGLLLTIFGSPVDSQAVDGFVQVCGAILSILSFLIAWVHRYNKGGVALSGKRIYNQ